jgi:hypothetical protein
MTREELLEQMARAIAYSAGSRFAGPGQSVASREIGWRGDGEHLDLYAERHWQKHTLGAELALSVVEKHGLLKEIKP